MNTNSYHTDQQKMIIQCFNQNKDRQMSASDIMNLLIKDGKKIGLATVYRQLETLEQQGLIRKFADENGKKACWQFAGGDEDCQHHYHLKCEKCGKIVHLDCNFVSDIDKHILQEHKFNMDRARTVFYGICEDCN